MIDYIKRKKEKIDMSKLGIGANPASCTEIIELKDLKMSHFDFDEELYYLERDFSSILYGIHTGKILPIYGKAVHDDDAIAAIEYLYNTIEFDSNPEYCVYLGFPTNEQLAQQLRRSIAICAIFAHFNRWSDYSPMERVFHRDIFKYRIMTSFLTLGIACVKGVEYINEHASKIMDMSATNSIIESNDIMDFNIHYSITDQLTKMRRWNLDHMYHSYEVSPFDSNKIINSIEEFYNTGGLANLIIRKDNYDHLKKLISIENVNIYITNRYINMSHLFGHIKRGRNGIDVIVSMVNLEDIRLYAITLNGLKFITSLKMDNVIKNGLAFDIIGVRPESIDSLISLIRSKHSTDSSLSIDAESYYAEQFEKLKH